MTDWRDHLITLEAAATLLIKDPGTVEVSDMPDIAGRVRGVERRLAEFRQGLNKEQLEAAKDPESEHGPGTFDPEPSPYGGTVRPKVQGKQFRTVTTRSCTRSYSTAPIIDGIARAEDMNPIEALMFAVQNGLATVAWKWTPLRNYAESKGLPLKKVQEAIIDDGDLDGPWIGEDWKESVRQEPVT